jgi:trigger factor
MLGADIMQVALETQTALKRKLTINLPAGQLDQAIAGRMHQAARNVDIKGFRKGKVPMQIINQRFGQQIRSEATEELVRSTLGPAIEQEKLRPATTPSITAMDNTSEGFKYVVEFEVMPEMGDLSLEGLIVERETADITDADIDRMIETLRMQRRSWADVTRASDKEDLVTFEFSVEIDGNRLPAQGLERAATVIGSNATLPGLEEGLTGVTAGQSKSSVVGFPDDYRDVAFAGKSGPAQLNVLSVQAPVLPAVDEEFVRSFGVPDGTNDAFRREIRSNLERELKGALSARLRAHITDKLIERFAGFDLPEGLVEQDARALRTQAVENARRQGATVSSEPDLAPFSAQAERRVRAGMVLNELARKNQMKLDNKRVIDALQAIASTYEDPREVMQMYGKDRNLMQSLQGRVMEEQVADWIAEKAQAKTISRSFAEVIAR